MASVVKPIILVTGALGSGKTSGLGALIAHFGYSSPRVLINDVGQVNDEIRFESSAGTYAAETIGGGCACCERSDEFLGRLLALLDDTSSAFDVIIFEASGVADPAAVVRLISEHPKLSHHIEASNHVHYVDATSTEGLLACDVALAETCVIAKSDLVSPGEIDELSAEMRSWNPHMKLLVQDVVDEHVRVLPAPPAAPDPVPAGSSSAPIALAEASRSERADVHVADFSLPTGLSWLALATWATALLARHGDRVLRLKASVPSGQQRVVLNGVRHTLFPPRSLENTEPRSTRGTLTVISTTQDVGLLLDSLQVFVDPAIEATHPVLVPAE
ncbi:GTP-binding protein [Leucobacter sp. USHLN153]|uniref:GTP-binding protein n=1 Tax=Leucobacter sp. USHLN153 TaxID=3081268 RepID=UPI003017B736